MTRCRIAALVLIGGCQIAAEPIADTARGDKLRDAYFRREVQRIADASLADIKTRGDWEKQRPILHRQFLEMLGLWPLPSRTELKPVITGRLEAEHFTVEKLHFQSLPGLYVTANLYLPKKITAPVPGILYVCGHGAQIKDGVSYGNKVAYQHHGAWYASNGYVCLIVDTLQLGEIQGIHHGLHNKGLWWWQTVGYTPAGIECWNGMRALDYLQSRKEVDPKRLGVTGRSGGGATSWWVGAADERVKAIVPVAGLGDLQAHVAEGVARRFRDGVISGHCDCMYFHNTYRWDFDEVIALCAPRALLLGNSDADDIFPVPGYRRPAAKAKRIFDLLGAGDHFALLETKGPHKDTPELRAGEYRWMNRWLKGDNSEVIEKERPRFTPEQLKVFDKLPLDSINATVHESFRKPAHHEPPTSANEANAWLSTTAPKLLERLKDQVFRGWPEQPPALKVEEASPIVANGLRLRSFDYVSEEEVPLRLWLLTGTDASKPKLVVLTAVNETGWTEWLSELGPDFKAAIQVSDLPPIDAEKAKGLARLLNKQPWALATVAPRGIGPTRWSEASAFDGKPAGQHIRRKFGLLGQTLDGQRVWDVRRAVACLRTVADLKGVPLWLQGKQELAGVVLYASLFEPDIARLDLWHPPASHIQGPTLLNVRLVCDMAQAMALAFPRKIRLYVKDDEEAKAWEWPVALQKKLGKDYLQIRKVPQ